MFHLRSPLYIYSKFPEKKPPSRFPSQSPTEIDAPFPEPFSTCLSQSPVKEPSPPPSKFPIRAPMETDDHHQGLFYLSLKICNKGTSLQVPLEALWREMPITRAFYTYHL
jgi:hypothetical protein